MPLIFKFSLSKSCIFLTASGAQLVLVPFENNGSFVPSLVPEARRQMRPMRIWGLGKIPDNIWGLSAQIRAVMEGGRVGVQGPWLPIYSTRGNQRCWVLVGAEAPPNKGGCLHSSGSLLSPWNRRGRFTTAWKCPLYISSAQICRDPVLFSLYNNSSHVLSVLKQYTRHSKVP